ncbi:MAG: 2,3-bisphosphoglycerate-independent phosphoglycerate mutase [Clostridia bacterium]|nr:2,3-bisphosphoglycerate-independent phosphoglycerate mutase [Clostridia bacterium]
MNNKLTMLMILDGFGENSNKDGNAVKLAKTSNIDKLMKKYPTTKITTSGQDVGLPEGQMNDSEVGKLNICTGRVLNQNLTTITKSIENGDFFTNPEFIAAIDNCKKHNSKLHIMGLLSDGGVHSHIRHLYALLEMAKRRDFEKVYIHCFLDGRDTPPASAEGYLSDLREKIKEKGIGKIASISGRYYSMDRDNRWENTKKTYDALVYGKGKTAKKPIMAIEQSYQKEEFDEFVEPIVINNSEGPIAKIDNNDSVIFFNYRQDRAKQLTRALVDSEFDKFKTKKLELYFVCFTDYDDTIPNVHIAFKNDNLKNTLTDVLNKNNLTSICITEQSGTYDSKSENSTNDLTNKTIEAIKSDKYNLIIVNYTSADIAGHTGSLNTTIKAIENIDKCVGKIIKEVNNKEGTVLITSNYGNCEQMIDYTTGEPHTAHTINPVPLIAVTERKDIKLKSGKLADIAPTILKILEIKKPKEMTGKSLIEFDSQ